MEYEVRTTPEFDAWLDGLDDEIARERVASRLIRAGLGNFGDHASVGGGVSEMRIHYGPGYRAYYTIRNRTVVFMLRGGDKSSQNKDIKNAKKDASGL
ncbi:type II toxin-antitoxin system RelE/ParE family toxin [Sphingomonas kyeonggiensis]|uniref:Putative addiction module killer protein n=1 Tax=Sphingomonas kyeonggiensis TaxID=1268553 RepID=A0A7W6JUF8_9SPHN|nr:type II toxin-antitoxin system RelE/ParE family toxin [Sphingomonas kyeonggiensis]MBB4099778.1 putative addiction module killer protein [Sphingomonas kyeonggiensis]